MFILSTDLGRELVTASQALHITLNTNNTQILKGVIGQKFLQFAGSNTVDGSHTSKWKHTMQMINAHRAVLTAQMAQDAIRSNQNLNVVLIDKTRRLRP